MFSAFKLADDKTQNLKLEKSVLLHQSTSGTKYCPHGCEIRYGMFRLSPFFFSTETSVLNSFQTSVWLRNSIGFITPWLLKTIYQASSRMIYIRMDTVVHFCLKKTRRYVMLKVWRHRAIQVRVETVVFSKHKTSLFCQRLLLIIVFSEYNCLLRPSLPSLS